MAADRSVTIRLRVSSAEFDAAMANAGTKIKILSAEVDSAGSKARGGAKGLDEFDRSAQKVSKSTKDAKGNVSLLGPALVALGPAILPLGAAAVGVGGAFGLMGAAGVLAVKGISAEMAHGTPAGVEYAGLLAKLKVNLGELEKTAATNFLGPFSQSVAQVQGFMPNLNREVGIFSTIAAKTGSSILSGLIPGFRDLEPLLLQVGIGAEGVSAKFATWLSNGGLQKFAGYAESVLPEVVQTIEAVAKAILSITGAAVPMGKVSLEAMHLVADAVNALPVGVLQTLVPVLAAGYLAFKAWAALAPVIATIKGITTAIKGYEVAQLEAAGVARATALSQATLGGGFRAAATGAAASASALGPVGLALGVVTLGIGAAVIALHHHSDAQKLDMQAVADYTQALVASKGAIDDNVKATITKKLSDDGAYAAGLKLGVNQKVVTDAFLGNATALAQVQAATDKANDSLAVWHNNYAAAPKSVIATKKAVDSLQGSLADESAAFLKAKQEAIDQIAATEGVAAAANLSSDATKAHAAALGLTVDQYIASRAAADQNTTSMLAQTAAMQAADDAAGLLRQAFDALNGKTLDINDANVQFHSSLLAVGSALKTNGRTLDLNTAAGVANNQAISRSIHDAQAHAESISKGTKLTAAGTAAYKADLIALRDQVKQYGGNTTAIQQLIDKIGQVPKSPKTDMDVRTDEASAKVAAFKAFLKTLPPSIAETVHLAGMEAAEYELQRLARSRQAVITVNVAGVSGVRSVGGVQANASGGSLPEGYSTINERGWELVHKSGSNVQVFSHEQSKQMLPAGPSVPAFASGTAPPSLTISAYGGVVDALVYGITSKSQLAAGAMAKLSKVMADAFTLKGVQAKMSALVQEASQFQGSIFSTLTGRTNVTQVGAGDNNPTGYIANVGAIVGGFNQQTRENQQFGGLIKVLENRGVSKAYLRALEEQGIGALPTLQLLANSSKASDLAAGRAYDRSISSAVGAAAVATNGQYGAQIHAFTVSANGLIKQVAALTNQVAALTKHQTVIELDGKVLARSNSLQSGKLSRLTGH